MKKLSILFFFFFSLCSYASIFSPGVTCENELNRASCGIKNTTIYVMTCEFLVVGETETGELLTQLKNSILLPYEDEKVHIYANNPGKDPIKFTNGEANCLKL